MRVKLILFVFSIFFLSSCSYEQDNVQNNVQHELLIFVVDESQVHEQLIEADIVPKMNVFVIEGDNNLRWFEETEKQRYDQNIRRALEDYYGEQEEFEYRTRLKNVKRVFDNEFDERELVVGYIPELDNPDFKEVEYW